MIGGRFSNGSNDQKWYFDSLAGSEGETIRFVRLGSCCGDQSKKLILGGGALLDKYQLIYHDLKRTVDSLHQFV